MISESVILMDVKELLSDADIIIRSIVSIVMLFIFTRLMGKKQISQLSFFDYIAGISIGSIAGEFTINEDISYIHGLIGIVVYSVIPIAIGYISLKGIKLRKILGDSPTILIQDGKFIEKNLKKSKFTINDVLEECRLKGAFNISAVEYAILETSGQVSVLLKPHEQMVTRKDLNIQASYEGIVADIIIDGKIIEDHLKLMNRDKDWLLKELEKKSIKSPGEVFLATMDSKGEVYIDLKNKDPKVLDVIE
ncbi:DUF421 domain-containing protein [Clostridium sp. YIM B02551]|uniref:DUF421 domain-containing protein n=1 Tax=Clostridium sp. YIM B02551 TaxID=2910679 RepID=UPI001EEC0207|nr:DUF421 domain-containing protein [Clostridium sp. YIM B02551]